MGPTKKEISAKLGELRDKIDDVDRKILNLLNRRARIVARVGDVKAKSMDGPPPRTLLYRPDREGSLLKRLKDLNTGPFPDDSIEPVFREIVSACRSLEIGLEVAYLGPEATYTHAAARLYFGHRANFVPMTTIGEVFDIVEDGHFDYGVVPIENSTGGTVGETLDLLVDTELIISNSIEMRVSHNLYSRSGDMEKVKKIYSHPQALAQSLQWIRAHLPKAKAIEVSSTAEAAKRALKEPDSAAVAGRLAGETYKLALIAEHIEDYRQNFTRFMVMGKTFTGRTGNDRTSLLLSVKDKPGSLFSVLEHFSKRGINMSKIESRPLKRKAWEYLFYIDVSGHIEDRIIKQALKEVEEHCLFLKVLGSYPAD